MALPATLQRPAAEPKPLRAGIYCRVSTAIQEKDGASLESQEASCRCHAAERGYRVDEALVFRETYSGVELWDRRQLTALREAIRRKVVDVVIVHAIDRLARDPVHLGLLITEAEYAGVRIEFVTEPLDNSPEGQLIRFVRGYAAKVEHEKIKERTLRNKRARAERGLLYNFGRELYGYRRDRDANVRTVYLAEAEVVREIFRGVVINDAGIRAVARRLNDRGVAPPSVGKAEREAARWGKSTIARILKEPAYKGDTIAWRWRGGKGENGRGRAIVRPESEWIRLPEGTTPPLVSAELWDAAQRKLEANRGAAARNEARPYLLRGLVACGTCGQPMRSSPEKGLRTYRCSSREKRPASAAGAGCAPTIWSGGSGRKSARHSGTRA